MLKRLRRASEPAASRAESDAAMTPAACPNCGAPATGVYCAQCGQETSIALPTARTFIREAAGRYVALDGRLWRTLAALFLRPGFLTREYLAGRRRRYVRPGRLFLVLSLALFATLRWVATPGSLVQFDEETRSGTAAPDAPATPGPAPAERMHARDGGEDDLDFTIVGEKYPLLAPLTHRFEQFNRLPKAQKTEQVFNGMVRYGPYAMVALLPVFAALMMFVYLGRAGRHPHRPRRYAAHLVFGAHDHAFLFLALIAFAAIHVKAVHWALALWIVVYLLRSMKVVYGGGWIGVLLRAALVTWLYVIAFGIAMAGLVVAAVALR